jgi:hypothetical protein
MSTTDDELRVAEMLLPFMRNTITTKDEVLYVVSPQKLIQAIKAYTEGQVNRAISSMDSIQCNNCGALSEYCNLCDAKFEFNVPKGDK